MTETNRRRRREVPTPELRCPTCGTELERFWSYCSSCGRRLEWRDAQKETNAECYYCGWIVSDAFSFCPWCGRDIHDAASSPDALPLGMRRRRDVSDALLPLVRPAAEVAL